MECSYCSSMFAVDMLIRPTEVNENDYEGMGEGKGYDGDGGGGGAAVHAATAPCAHVLCLVCATNYVRQAMGDRAAMIQGGGVRCPGGRDCRSMVTVGAVGRLVGRSEDPSCRSKLEHHDEGPVQPLTREDQAKFGRMVQAALIPALQRRYCANAACVDADGARNVTDIGTEAPPEFVCAFCQTRMCALALPGGLPCGRESHRFAKGIWSCEAAKDVEALQWAREEAEAAGRALWEAEEKGLVHAGADLLTTTAIAATTKPCPKCGAGVSHYHGHSCHHISPSGGCPSCGQHFCYSCLGLGRHCRSCKVYCSSRDIVANLKPGADWPVDKRCGCPICPDCRPGRKPCVHCHGDCVVCMGVIPPGALDEEAVRRKAGAGSGGGRRGGAEGKAGGGGDWENAEDSARQAILGTVVSAKGNRGNVRLGRITDYDPLRTNKWSNREASSNKGKHEVTFRRQGGGSGTQWLDLARAVDWTVKVVQSLDQADEAERMQVAMAASRIDASRAETNRVIQAEEDRVARVAAEGVVQAAAKASKERNIRIRNAAIAGAGGVGLVAIAGPAAVVGAGAAAVGGIVTAVPIVAGGLYAAGSFVAGGIFAAGAMAAPVVSAGAGVVAAGVTADGVVALGVVATAIAAQGIQEPRPQRRY